VAPWQSSWQKKARGRLHRIGVNDRFGQSGTPEALYEEYGFDAPRLEKRVRSFRAGLTACSPPTSIISESRFTPGSRLAEALALLGSSGDGNRAGRDREKVDTAWIPLPVKPGSVELLQPTEAESTIGKFLAKAGTGWHPPPELSGGGHPGRVRPAGSGGLSPHLPGAPSRCPRLPRELSPPPDHGRRAAGDFGKDWRLSPAP
jgi:hypothetical protein